MIATAPVITSILQAEKEKKEMGIALLSNLSYQAFGFYKFQGSLR